MSSAEIVKEHAEHPWTTIEQAQQIVKEHHTQPKEQAFDGLEYTRRDLKTELYQTQKHASDGSAFQLHCSCIQEKHLLGIKGTASEGVTLALDPKEQRFYQWLAPWADATLDHVIDVLNMDNRETEAAMYRDLANDTREIRLEIDHGSFEIPNPASTRAYLPRGLTRIEKDDPEIRKLLSRCIKSVEIKCCGGPTSDYSKCDCNPVAICRQSVEH